MQGKVEFIFSIAESIIGENGCEFHLNPPPPLHPPLIFRYQDPHIVFTLEVERGVHLLGDEEGDWGHPVWSVGGRGSTGWHGRGGVPTWKCGIYYRRRKREVPDEKEQG